MTTKKKQFQRKLRCSAHRACGVHASNKIWTSNRLEQTVSTFSLEAKKIWSAKSKEFDHAGAQCSYEVGVASTRVVIGYLFFSFYNSCRFSSRSESWPCTVGGFVRFLLDDCDFGGMSELNACKPRTLNPCNESRVEGVQENDVLPKAVANKTERAPSIVPFFRKKQNSRSPLKTRQAVWSKKASSEKLAWGQSSLLQRFHQAFKQLQIDDYLSAIKFM